MNRKFNIGATSTIIHLILISMLASKPAVGQEGVNVVSFLDAVARTCGGTSGVTYSSPGSDVAFKNSEISIDKGTGEIKIKREGELIASADGLANDSYYTCVENLTKALGGFVSSNNEASSFDVFKGSIGTSFLLPRPDDKTSVGNSDFEQFVSSNTGSVVYLDVSRKCCGIYPINYFISTVCGSITDAIVRDDLKDPNHFLILSFPILDFNDLERAYPTLFHGSPGISDSLAAFETLFTNQSFLPNGMEYEIKAERCSLPIAVEADEYFDMAGCGTSCSVQTFNGFYLVQERLTRHTRYYMLTEQEASPSEWSAASRQVR
ncbi:MAG: hypothetical protein AAFR98_08865 [Pseudomonadota bacterium]